MKTVFSHKLKQLIIDVHFNASRAAEGSSTEVPEPQWDWEFASVECIYYKEKTILNKNSDQLSWHNPMPAFLHVIKYSGQ